jgi:hypothetical protein
MMLGDRNQRNSPAHGLEGLYFAKSSSGTTTDRMKASSSSLNPSISLLPTYYIENRKKKNKNRIRKGRMLCEQPDG